MTDGTKKMIKIFSGLGGLFMCLLIALGFKVFYAIKTNQPVLRKDYYETGRRYDRYLKSARNTANRQLKSPLFKGFKSGNVAMYNNLSPGQNFIQVLYSSNNSQGIANADVHLHLGRRSTTNQDIDGKCVTNNLGKCSISLIIPATGYWEGALSAKDSNGRYTLRGSFIVK